MIEIMSYQPRWVTEFREAGAGLRRALGDLALRIDHIGSTSVPGLAAKDILDLQVTVASLDPDLPIIEALKSAGYRMLGEIREDHRPPGDTSPDVHWRKRFFNEPEGRRRMNVHVRMMGHANQRYALLFRDFLRSNPLAAGGYEAVKRQLAHHHADDVEAYYDVKDPVCDVIMAGAEAWAAASGWRLGPSDA